MKRETFVAILEAIRSQSETDDRISKAIDVFSENDSDGLNNKHFVFTTPLNDKLVRALEIEFNDERSGWISWFIWDTDWGSKGNAVIKLGSDKVIRLRSPGDLYDWLKSPEAA